MLAGRDDAERVSVFLFAAAVIVQRTKYGRIIDSDYNTLARSVVEWISSQRPKYALSHELEQSIRYIGQSERSENDPPEQYVLHWFCCPRANVRV
ncbi:hypothetical protein CLV88_102480 [Shimia abyssi]|uniref:Uncharacterized protein n=1 Tax=Shimia abyssi TaxID=1662395 RepID=A0A2P8FI28_9RHOB|nr:hypothetical protein CLV88_102480 [Shimia abyssi]